MNTQISICAMSDLHGHLPDPEQIEKVDVVVICGDIVPLKIQRANIFVDRWLKNEFKEWVQLLPCERVILTPGNHDFYFHSITHTKLEDTLNHIGKKLVYLEDDSYIYKGVSFYGCPWCTGPLDWAFCPGNSMLYHGVFKEIVTIEDMYNKIPECDVLLTHQPPSIGNLGTSFYWDKARAKDWGSDRLRVNLKDKNILVNFSGHVHSGDHERTLYPTLGCDTVFYNVSIKNEQYKVAFQPRYILLNKEDKTVIEMGTTKMITLD
jgi:Icc-related predicted phosphoesterase